MMFLLDVPLCPYDASACDRFREDLIGDATFGACAVKDSDGKLIWVCPRHSIDFDLLLERVFGKRFALEVILV